MRVVVVMRKSMLASSHSKKLMCSVQVDCFLETTGKSISFVLVLQILQTKSAASVFFILLANGGHMVGSRSIPDKDKGKDRHTDSCSYSLLESGPLTLLLQHVKHSTHSIQNALKWPPAPVIMITSRLENNALRSPRHVSTSVWQSKCH